MELTVVLNRGRGKILFTKADKKCADIVFSILTFPFQSISAAFRGNSSLQCIDNLHYTAKRLCNNGYIVPEKWHRKITAQDKKLMYLAIAPHHNCPNELHKIGKPPQFLVEIIDCKRCSSKGKPVCHLLYSLYLNHKYTSPRIRCGGGYIRCPKTFVITDALVVKPLSEISDVIRTPDLRMDYEERKIVIGQKEVTWKELF